MRLLVHVCCGPCAIMPFKTLFSSKGLDSDMVWGFFYNHNIHPYQEYKRRLDAVKRLEELMGLNMIYRDEYAMEEFLKNVAHDPDNRCDYCYRSRLEATAKEAVSRKFDAFSTSLLYSRYQRHESIREIGEEISSVYNIDFFYYDFRDGWKEGIVISKEMGLYRQPYCGCIYSEKERYLKEQGS